jgi:glutathione S-transferase
MLTLYYATNTCALASHIALEEAGAAFETRWVDFGAAEQTKPEYLKINPKGRVPALVACAQRCMSRMPIAPAATGGRTIRRRSRR